MKCSNKQCEHRWYCKKYEMPTEATWQDHVNLSNECNILNDYALLEIDKVLKDLYNYGVAFRKMFPNVKQEDINKSIEEIRNKSK